MKKTFLFYDIETTGLNNVFDQVLQFAAIRTDLELNEISRHEIRIRLRDDVTPSPYAVKTHGISMEAMQEGDLEVDGIQQIHALMNKPGTISLGYNTLGFDDEFLRFSFYRNLLPAYTHQYVNQCGRMDIYPITVLYYLFGKADLQWPTINDVISFKLENLNDANHLASGKAHDAMVDVEVTLALAKRLKKQEDMWAYCEGYFNKKTDLDRIAKLDGEGVYLAGILGAKNHFHAPVLCLGQHWHYKNQLVYLRLDLPELQQTNVDEIDKTTWTFRKKPGEPGIILPTHERFMKHLSKERLDIANTNKAWLASHPKIKQAISDYYLDFKFPIVPEADVDSILYQTGFNSSHDTQLCEQFHQAEIMEKAALIPQLESHELQALAVRVLGRNYPEALSGDVKVDYQAYLTKIKNNEPMIDFRHRGKYTVILAREDLETLLDGDASSQHLSDEQKTLLQAMQESLLAK